MHIHLFLSLRQSICNDFSSPEIEVNFIGRNGFEKLVEKKKNQIESIIIHPFCLYISSKCFLHFRFEILFGDSFYETA